MVSLAFSLTILKNPLFPMLEGNVHKIKQVCKQLLAIVRELFRAVSNTWTWSPMLVRDTTKQHHEILSLLHIQQQPVQSRLSSTGDSSAAQTYVCERGSRLFGGSSTSRTIHSPIVVGLRHPFHLRSHQNISIVRMWQIPRSRWKYED